MSLSHANAFILYQLTSQTGAKSLPLKEFRAQLARELIGSYNSRKQAGRPRQAPVLGIPCGSQTLRHFPRKTQKGRCRRCHTGYTTWWCAECKLRFCHSGNDSNCLWTTTLRSSCTTKHVCKHPFNTP